MVQPGNILRLQNLNGLFNGLKVCVETITNDEEGENIEVKLLEAPLDRAYRVGDVISVHRYQLKVDPQPP